MLIVHLLMNAMFCYSIDYFIKFLKFQAIWMLVLFALATHLQLFEDYEDLLISMGGLYFFLPLMIINANEIWQITMPLYFITEIYPVYRVSQLEFFANSDLLIKCFFFAIYHYVSLLIIVIVTQRNRVNLFLEK